MYNISYKEETMKILVVEDERILAKNIAKGLTKKGYAVDVAHDGEAAIYMIEVNQYDLVVLDINLPIHDGIYVLKSIKAKDNNIKTIILSAKNEIEDRIYGLDNGADDYLGKPFEFSELDARIRNLLRRNFNSIDHIIDCGLIKMDTNQKQVYCDEVIVHLTKKEYGILEYLLFNRGRIVAVEEIIEHVWNSDYDPFSNAFKFQMYALRKKLVSHNIDYIVNYRAQGYLLSYKGEEHA